MVDFSNIKELKAHQQAELRKKVEDNNKFISMESLEISPAAIEIRQQHEFDQGEQDIMESQESARKAAKVLADIKNKQRAR